MLPVCFLLVLSINAEFQTELRKERARQVTTSPGPTRLAASLFYSWYWDKAWRLEVIQLSTNYLHEGVSRNLPFAQPPPPASRKKQNQTKSNSVK